MSNTKKLAIVIWLFVLTANLMTAFMPFAPDVDHARTKGVPLDAPPNWFLILPLIAFPLTVYFARHSPFYHPRIAAWIDARFGENTYEHFHEQVQPFLLFGTAGMAQIGLRVVLQDTSHATPFDAFGLRFMISGSVGFLLAHVAWRLRQATRQVTTDE